MSCFCHRRRFSFSGSAAEQRRLEARFPAGRNYATFRKKKIGVPFIEILVLFSALDGVFLFEKQLKEPLFFKEKNGVP